MFRDFATLVRIGVVDFQHRLFSGLEFKLLRGDFDDFGIGSDRRVAEIAKNHLAVARGDLLPLAEHDVVHCLLDVELRHRCDRSSEPAEAYRIVHLGDHVVVLVHHVVITQHLSVRREGAARHGGPDNFRAGSHCLGRGEVFGHSVFEHSLRLAELLYIDVDFKLAAAQRMPERDHVGLARAA